MDNPLIDIHLTAAMMSPVYGFTADDMAVLRMKEPPAPLPQLSGNRAGGGFERAGREAAKPCAKTLASFSELRTIASSSPAHRLIQQLIDKPTVDGAGDEVRPDSARQTSVC